MRTRCGCLRKFWLCILLSCLPASALEADAIGPDPLHRDLGAHGRQLAEEAVQFALETLASQRTYRWHDSIDGASGMVRPLRTFRIKTGHYCREYSEVIQGPERFRSARRVACRDNNGIWVRAHDQSDLESILPLIERMPQ